MQRPAEKRSLNRVFATRARARPTAPSSSLIAKRLMIILTTRRRKRTKRRMKTTPITTTILTTAIGTTILTTAQPDAAWLLTWRISLTWWVLTVLLTNFAFSMNVCLSFPLCVSRAPVSPAPSSRGRTRPRPASRPLPEATLPLPRMLLTQHASAASA